MKTIRSMLKHLFLAVPLMLIMSCNSQPPSTLIPHRCENGKFGYVDEKGKEWIEGKYDYAEEFSEDLAVVQVGRYFGYIDRKGEIVIPLQYTQAAYFLQGRALVAKEELYGFIDKENRGTRKEGFVALGWYVGFALLAAVVVSAVKSAISGISLSI